MRWIEAGLGLALAGIAVAQAPMGASAPAPAQTPFTVVLDAAHGGSDTGARLANGVLEKNITLRVAEQLESLLRAQGIAVTMTRTGDIDVPELNRAEIANHAQAAACVVIHATDAGNGVHLFTSSIAPQAATGSTPRILPWATAQAAYVTQSLKLESEMDAALMSAEVPVTMGRAAVEPLNHLACAAVAVELAPPAAARGGGSQTIAGEPYQQTVERALTEAITSWRRDRMVPRQP